MIIGVKDMYYNVSDMKKAVAFYQKILGMEVITQDDYWTNLAIDGVAIGLHWT